MKSFSIIFALVSINAFAFDCNVNEFKSDIAKLYDQSSVLKKQATDYSRTVNSNIHLGTNLVSKYDSLVANKNSLLENEACTRNWDAIKAIPPIS